MIAQRYKNLKTKATYDIWIDSDVGNVIFNGSYKDKTGKYGPKQNYCYLGIDDENQRGSKRIVAVQVGTIEVNPQRQGLGSLMLFHVLNYASGRDAINEMHICDGEPGQKSWQKVFNEGIRLPNLPSDTSDLDDYRANAGPIYTKLKQSAFSRGWDIIRPESINLLG